MTQQQQEQSGKTENSQLESSPTLDVTVCGGGRYLRFDGTTWPSPATDVGWRLRYGQPTREDLLFAASVLDAYGDLVIATAKRRAYIVRRLRAPNLPPLAPALAVDSSRSSPNASAVSTYTAGGRPA